jgi:hypothetical protein
MRFEDLIADMGDFSDLADSRRRAQVLAARASRRFALKELCALGGESMK